MAASPIKINVSSVAFTPSGGSSNPITGAQSATLTYGMETVKARGDGDYFNSFIASVGADIAAGIETNRPGTMNSITPGALGTLVFTENDGHNGATSGGGALIYTLANCVFSPGTHSVKNPAASSFDANFESASTDGVTSPLAVTAA